MARRSKLRRAISLAGPGVQVHDRQARDLTINAIVAPVEVKDPYGDRIVVLRSLRDDPLAGMFARRQIDQAQYDGGRAWQKCMEESEVGNIRAIDPTKEAVDGGRCPEPLSDRYAHAHAKLKEAHSILGMIGENIVRDILGSRLTIMEAGQRRGYTTKDELAFMGRRFREALDTLAVVFGCATGGRE
jgi:hypothetical protein